MKHSEHSSLSKLYKQHKEANKAPAGLTQSLIKSKQALWKTILSGAVTTALVLFLVVQYCAPSADQPAEEQSLSQSVFDAETVSPAASFAAKARPAIPMHEPLLLINSKTQTVKTCDGLKLPLPDKVNAPQDQWFQITQWQGDEMILIKLDGNPCQ